MNTTTARITALEAVVDRLTARKGAKISDLLRQARARAIAGEPPPDPVLHGVAELEAMAKLPGIRGAMARSQLRALRAPAPEGLLPPSGVRQDGGVDGAGHPDASHEPTRSTRLQDDPPPASKAALLARIDAALARANGHA